MSVEIVVAIIGVAGAVAGAAAGAVIAYGLSRRRMSDKEQFLQWRVAFDRPAFKGPYLWHTCRPPFVAAMDATIKALTTGMLTSRSGREIRSGKGISELRRGERRSQVDQVVTLLRRIRERVKSVKPDEAVDPAMAELIDADRDAVINSMNSIWRRLGIPELPLPSKATDVSEVGYQKQDVVVEREPGK